MATVNHEFHDENTHNISLLHLLTESWLNVTYIGETETRIWLIAKLTLSQLTAELT